MPPGLLERGTECINKIMRKMPDEAYRVRDHHVSCHVEVNHAKCRVERRKELIRGVYPGAGKEVEECRLSRVGVAYERDNGNTALLPGLAALASGPSHILELAPDALDLLVDLAAVKLNLLLARSSSESKPPFCLSRWVQPRTSMVERWVSLASSTWSFPS